jgi:putative hemolysin
LFLASGKIREMSKVVGDILIILALILANGLFAMAEVALVSARRSRLQQRAAEGDRGADAALRLLSSPNRFLSTTQIGISLIGVLSGAVGGATLSEPLAGWLKRFPFAEPYAEAASFAIVVMAITYISLVIGELIPKRLGLNDPEKVAAGLASLMTGLSRLASPLVALLSASTEGGLRLLRVKRVAENHVTEEEIRILLRESAARGAIPEEEQDILESVFRLGARRIDALMVPRTEISFLRLDEPLESIVGKIMASSYSRFPVISDTPDDIAGILAIKDLFDQQQSGTPFSMEALLTPPVFVLESTPALKLLEIFRSSSTEMALVIDEYGGVMGLVTPYDVLTSVVGEISQQVSGQLSESVQQADGSWIFDGMYQIDVFKEDLHLDELPDEEHNGYQTAGGFVMSALGAIPRPGDSFTLEGYSFKVLAMDGRRVEKILVSPISDGESPA